MKLKAILTMPTTNYELLLHQVSHYHAPRKAVQVHVVYQENHSALIPNAASNLDLQPYNFSNICL